MKANHLDFPSPAALEVQAQFEHWRKTRTKRGKIPQELWSAAAELTKLHGITRIAKLMRINPSELSKKARSVSSAVIKTNKESPVSFIELPQISNCTSGSCEIDLKRPDGSEMRIRLSSSNTTELSGLVRAFVN